MIGKKLKYLIKSTKHKQIDLAKYLGISPSRLSNYLSDKREPDFAMLAQMVKFLGSDLNTLSGVDFGEAKAYPEPESDGAAVHDSAAPYGGDLPDDIIYVHKLPINAKKRGINSVMLPVSLALFDKVKEPEKNAAVFQVNCSVPDGIAEENDYMICAKCSSTVVSNGSRVFENGRNAKFFRFYKDKDFYILVNEDNNKEHVRLESEDDLNNYYKILWVVKKY